MGWQDREYGNEAYAEYEAGTRPRIRRPPAFTFGLMLVHLAAFVLVFALGRDTAAAGVLTGLLHSPAGIILHPYATTGLLTILFVVLALWSLGGRLEPRVGPARLITVYAVANLAAGGAYVGMAVWQPTLAASNLDYPIGALAALCVLAWRHLRHEPVQVLGILTTLGKMYAVMAAIALTLELLMRQEGALAWLLAAATGAVAGELVDQVWQLGRRQDWRRRRVRPSIPKRPPVDDTPDVDEILAKISRSGIETLSRRELAQLEQARRALLRRGG